MNNNNFKYSNFKKLIRLVIFDLDGTLTVPVMDFKKLKSNLSHLGFQPHQDVLQVLETLSIENQEKANKIIYEFELDARNNLIVQENTEILLKFLQDNNIFKAIHSRNSKENIKYFIDKLNHFSFHHYVGREILPPKPMPAGSLEILRVINQDIIDDPITPDQVIFVGDSIDDIKTSKSFGSLSCLLLNEFNRHHSNIADIEINNLIELKDILINFNNLKN